MQDLMGALTQHGYAPEQAGFQNTNPYTMSPGEAARMTGYAQQQNPDLLRQIMGPGGPLGSSGAKMAVAGIAALASPGGHRKAPDRDGRTDCGQAKGAGNQAFH